MKRLSINDIAKASLRTGKRAYLSLAIGIFLSIFLVTSLFMTVSGISLAREEQLHQKVGRQDMIIFQAEHSPSEIMASGLHDRIGVVSVAARVKDTGWFLAHYDETAAELRNHQFIEGGLPEKPGEIAVEQQLLDYLRSDAGAGDSITLTVTPVAGKDEERTFVISGVLVNQGDGSVGESYIGFDRIMRMPSAVIHPEETFATGRINQQYLLTMKKGESRDAAMSYWGTRGEVTAFHSQSGYLQYGAFDERIEKYWNEATVSLYIIAIALTAACCVGISQALESVLTRRVDQIGMLRAVGATKRQIRKIFGREAWLLAAILSPLSVAAGIGFVWIVSLIVPDAVKFIMEWRMILPILLLSAAFILLAAGLPLRRASQILPMGVIRDTAMLRKVKGIKSKKVFTAPRLIAGRQIRLHWSRQIGAALMVMMMLVVTGVAGGLSGRDMGSYWDDQGEYEIRFDSPSYDAFVDTVPLTYLNQADIKQILSLEHVEKVKILRELYINLNVLGEVPEYLRQHIVNYSNDHMEAEFDENSEGMKRGIAEHEAALTAFQKTGTLAQMRLWILPEEDLKLLTENVTEGRIDEQAIREGREVLVYAPDLYRRLWVEESFSYYSYSVESPYNTPEEVYEFFMANDAFSVGQTLPLTYAYLAQTDEQMVMNEAWTIERYEALDTVEASPTIGAVLGRESPSTSLWNLYAPCLITTEQGAQAMGLPLLQMGEMEVYLDGEVDRETEDYLTGRIESICRRASIWHFYNNIEAARENRELQSQLILAMAAAVAVFFMSSFSMISGSVKRRIRADERMIGTLRAVGADKKTVVKCYLMQSALTVVLGFSMAAAACLVIVLLNPSLMTLTQCVSVGLVMLALAAGCFGLCTLSVNRAVGEVMKRSVVENIREL